MKKLVFKFKRTEDDHIIAFRALKKERFGNIALTMEQWSQLNHEAYVPLIQGYLEADKPDELIKYVLDQCDSGTNGFDFFERISDALVSKNDKPRLLEFWTRVVMSRERIDHINAAFEALKLMRIASEKLGDSSAADELQIKLDRKKKKTIVKSPKKLQQDKLEDKQPNSDMTESKFWELIEGARHDDQKIVEGAIRVHKLQTELLKLDLEQVRRFAEIFEQKMNQSYTWDLWAIAYLAFGGCSDDGFAYFRGWLISEGKVVFDKMVQNPEIIVELGIAPDQLESILYVAEEVFSELTNDELELTEANLKEPAGVEWEESEKALKKRFPKAYAFFQ